MVILPNMAKTVKRPLFHYFFAFFHILRCPYHGFSGHRVFLTHFWGCMRGGLWVLCAEVQKSQNASPVLKVLPPPRGGGGGGGGGGGRYSEKDKVDLEWGGKEKERNTLMQISK